MLQNASKRGNRVVTSAEVFAGFAIEEGDEVGEGDSRHIANLGRKQDGYQQDGDARSTTCAPGTYSSLGYAAAELMGR